MCKLFQITLGSILFINSGYSQKKVDLDITLKNNLPNDCYFALFFENGQDDKPFQISNSNRSLHINEVFFGRYAEISIGCYCSSTGKKLDTSSKRFWVTDKKSSINLSTVKTLKKLEPIYQLENVIDVDYMGERKAKNFTLQEDTAYINFFNSNLELFQSDPSLGKQLNERMLAITNKKLDFIKANPTLYYSLRLFKNYFSGNTALGIDTLENIYSYFPDSLRNTFEGAQIEKTFFAIKHTTKDAEAPIFSVVDIFNKTHSSEIYRGKYILIDFWASWCSPCINDLQYLKEIRKTYSTTDLIIISISVDNSRDAFDKALKKYSLNWIHVYNNSNITKQFNVDDIPQTYLINKDGKILYSRDEEKDFDKLSILRSILARQLESN